MKCLNKSDDFNALIIKMIDTPECVAVILDEIFSRSYQLFDRTMKAYLAFCGFDIHDEMFHQLYLEWIYPDIFEGIFRPDIFLNKVEKYDAKKGQFLVWLRTVIRNTVRDWLRKVGPETGLSNFERLGYLCDIYKNSEPISEIEPADIMPDEDAGGHAGRLQNIFDSINPKYQTILRLCYLAYIDPTQQDIDCICMISKKTDGVVRKEISDIKRLLITDDKYEQNLKMLKIIDSGTFTIKLRHCEQEVYQLRKKIEHSGFDEETISTLEHDALSKTFKEVTNEQALMKDNAADEKPVENEKCNVDFRLTGCQYMMAFKKLIKYQKKQEELVSFFNTGKIFKPQPSRDQLAALYNEKPQFVDNLKIRAKRAIESAYEKAQQA